MTTVFTGSNFGTVSSLNSGSGTLTTTGDKTSFTFENTNNFACISVLLTLTGSGYATLRVIGGNNASATLSSTQELRIVNTGSQTYTFFPSGPFTKVELEANANNVGYNIQTRYFNGTLPPAGNGQLSVLNSFIQDTSVSATETLNGTFEDASLYSLITILTAGTATTPGDTCPGTLQIVFSSDGTNIDHLITIEVQDIAANGTASATTSLAFNPSHTIVPISKYFKLNYINGANSLSSIRISTEYHRSSSKNITSRGSQLLTDYIDADSVRSILVGRTFGTTLPGGQYQNIGVSNQSLNVAIREPLSAFGELLNAPITPIIQIAFANGEPTDLVHISRNSLPNTSYTYQNGSLNIGVSAVNSIIRYQSRGYSTYKTGQGLDARFTAVYTSGYEDGSNQFAGLTNIEDRLGFGYFDSAVSGTDEFSIIYSRHGLLSIRAFDISGTASGNGTITYTFDATNVVVNFSSGETAKDIAYNSTVAVLAVLNLNTYGWSDDYIINSVDTSATVLFFSNIASNISASAVSSGSGISISTNTSYSRNGSSPTTTYLPQSQWNIDRCADQGSLLANYQYNPSGFHLDPTKGNVFKINIQYLGFGAITFFIESPEIGLFIPVHQIKYANANTITSLGIPSFRVGYTLENTTNTNTVSMTCTSVFTALQGIYLPTPIYRSYGNTLSTNNVAVLRTAPRVIFGLRGRNVFQSTNSNATTTNTMNRNNIFLTSFSGACTLSNANQFANMTFIIVRNPSTITYSSTSAPAPWKIIGNNGVYVFDGVAVTASTGVSFTGGEVILEFDTLDNNNVIADLKDKNIYFTPDDTYLVAFYTTLSGANYNVQASLSWQLNL